MLIEDPFERLFVRIRDFLLSAMDFRKVQAFQKLLIVLCVCCVLYPLPGTGESAVPVLLDPFPAVVVYIFSVVMCSQKLPGCSWMARASDAIRMPKLIV